MKSYIVKGILPFLAIISFGGIKVDMPSVRNYTEPLTEEGNMVGVPFLKRMAMEIILKQCIVSFGMKACPNSFASREENFMDWYPIVN